MTPNVQLYTLPASVEDPRDLIDWKQRSVVVFGTTHLQPRLTRWYGPTEYTYSHLTWEADPLPEGLQRILREVEALTGHEFNSVLCNLYRDGSDCIGWHSDDEALFGTDPVVASVSFGATRMFKMRTKTEPREKYEVALTDHSLLVMGKGVQELWQHSIPAVGKSKPVGVRVNLTFRKVIGV